MERAVWLAAATWMGGVGAWGVGVGYALGRARDGGEQAPSGACPPSASARMQLGGDDEPPTPPVEVLDVNDLPTPPLPLDAPVSQGARARSASPDIIDVDDLDDDSFMRRADEQQSRSGSLSDSDVEVGTDSDSEVFLVGAERSRDLARPRSDLAAAPPDISSLLTESQRRRLAPIQPLQRKRRSRKIRREEQEEETFIPLVRGARATQDEAILNAYNGETLETKREQGEDYWVSATPPLTLSLSRNPMMPSLTDACSCSFSLRWIRSRCRMIFAKRRPWPSVERPSRRERWASRRRGSKRKSLRRTRTI